MTGQPHKPLLPVDSAPNPVEYPEPAREIVVLGLRRPKRNCGSQLMSDLYQSWTQEDTFPGSQWEVAVFFSTGNVSENN